MPLRCFSRARTLLTLALSSRARRRIFGLALLSSIAAGCGGESQSTDTGNPPVVLGQKLRLTATATGVAITGDPGAVPAGTRVDVVNTSTGQSETTTAAADGSFEVEIEGSTADEYRVYAASGGQSWRSRLTSSGGTAPEAGFAGLEYLLQSAEGYTLVPGTLFRLSFQEDELSFSAGCNSHFGPYSLCDGKLCVSGLGSTLIGCDSARQTQDEWFAAFLLATPTVTQSGARLTLAGAQATLELLDGEVADPDRPLAGRTWAIDTFIEGEVATGFPPSTAPTPTNFPLLTVPMLQFEVDGSLRVFTSCNRGDGSYTRSGQTLTLSDITYTEEPCDASGNAAAQERIQRVIAAGTLSVEIDSRRLTLLRGTLGLGATTE